MIKCGTSSNSQSAAEPETGILVTAVYVESLYYS